MDDYIDNWERTESCHSFVEILIMRIYAICSAPKNVVTAAIIIISEKRHGVY